MASPLHLRELATRIKVGMVADSIIKYPPCQPGSTVERLGNRLADAWFHTGFSVALKLTGYSGPNLPSIVTHEYTKMWAEISDFYEINNWEQMSDARLNEHLCNLRDQGGTLRKVVSIENLGDEILSIPVTSHQIAESEQKWIDCGYIDYEENRAEKLDGAIDWMNRIRNVGRTSRFAKGAANLWN